ncbi:MAG: sugar nucleotide-binding protein [Paenarthrobacter ureafaciens]|uniref:bifunctional dTDP-4-dehydrorhamnose 3,5-epimerase family protein/NAD(P)-dependent oxidoreductase n=1 Tax=Paenarthrobacter ureafaciens TaxID=37931 RepID=UPI001AC4D617|nr:bifunctional dTDP-4-dehydrorhamnose 3,5-epimerase family protein/NAD(P)-dependent oxidoreductase [Paenarthrobacter ureafaciens]MBN9130443.1 sugar nucleotide-binding protein [Paenarthrobacter ureafaciens]
MAAAATVTSRTTPIPGLLVFGLPVHGDQRGWFKENWNRSSMGALGLPDFGPVQNNISFNARRGTTRGIHAEPWDKFISLASGKIFGAWVDLREGPSFGAVFHCEMTPGDAVFVPRGVGNAFQTLEDNTAYTYLVNDHWSAGAQDEYTFLNLADPHAAVPWPLPLNQATLSEQDKNHPRLESVVPVKPRRILVPGANGQLGRALREAFADVDYVDFATRDEFDVTDEDAYRSIPWRKYSTIINATAFTGVDVAETAPGRTAAWRVNAGAVSRLARTAVEHSLTLVHVSSDYVFDGSAEIHTEDEPPSPLGVYGQSKAAGDTAVAAIPRHYIVRSSWVVGDGPNFVRTMAQLAERGVRPSVVDDQWGRLTFAADIAAGIKHLLASGAPYGTYNLSGGGEPKSWAGIAREVYRLCGSDPDMVVPVSTEQYSKPGTAPRPRNSTLALSKIEASGFVPAPVESRLAGYLMDHATDRTTSFKDSGRIGQRSET